MLLSFKDPVILLSLLTMFIIFSLDSANSLLPNILFRPINAQIISTMNSSITTEVQNQTAENSTIDPNLVSQKEEVFIVQNTSISVPAPVRHPGQPPHEVVFALPLRDDGKIWSGRVTFTASKPIEAEILHIYNPQQPIDEKHGEPYYAVLPGNRSVAISHLRDLVDVPIEINGTGISSGSFEFEGSALVFHKTSGEPFTVTYTVNAVANTMTKIE
ncbi:MAG: hypothetical protein K0S67_366 [Nitrososphaeraceae archaeon]|nr:hypothetical protein [Nitrososphaeraceae archaeon]MCD6036482.1 hypothetical protein [Nitrososphaeraceae archaeon]MDF2767742.1 hypothetical protein [Nitrososphaeraceae archaeon]